MKLIVGLGNPGQKYEKNRHNVGFAFIDRFVQSNQIGTFSYNNKYGAEISEGVYQEEKILCIKPMIYMNKSGGPTQQIANFYKIAPENILVIHDEIDLPVGTIKIKQDGGLAGHNGLKDIAAKLGTKAFWRVRIGVDRPPNKDHVADYVLSNFKSQEKKHIEDAFLDIENIIKEWL